MGKGSVEPPVWAPGLVDQWERGVWEGAGSFPPMGSYGARPGPGGGAAARVRFSRSAAAAEDVGHARAGGGAGPERAAGRPSAAAGRLRRCEGPCSRGRRWTRQRPPATSRRDPPAAGLENAGPLRESWDEGALKTWPESPIGPACFVLRRP